MSARVRCLPLLLTLTLTLVAGLVTLITAPPRSALSASRGHMVPSVQVNPAYRRANQAGAGANPFACQNTTPVTCFGPQQIAAAYGIDKLTKRGLTGKGRSITIVDAYSSPTIRHDLALFDKTFGLANAPLHIYAPQGATAFDPNSDEQVSWAGEISLDVEWAHAIAPAATVNLVLARSNSDPDIYAALRWAVDRSLGDVISQSFGEGESCMASALRVATDRVFARAVSKGMTVLASSGDYGAGQLACTGDGYTKQVATPASSPLVLGIGGTQLSANPAGTYLGETAWNEPRYRIAGGGGYSRLYTEPGYQRGVQHDGHRGVPDVAYNAGVDTGVLVAWSSSRGGSDLFFRFGGTSAGSPQWAGLVALTDQAAHRRIGFVNDDLYVLGTVSERTFYHDVSSGDNTLTAGTQTVRGYSAHAGWDPVTGLGSPRADRLVPALALVAGGHALT
jgi:subtilase family serine protease